MVGRLIRSQACLTEGSAWLAARDVAMARALADIEAVPLRLRSDGFAALLDAIVSQQISVAAARGIWGRMEDAGLCCEDAIGRADDGTLRAAGLSLSKVRYARALAQSGIDYDGLRGLPDAEVISRLTAVTGIGRWTADIYCMFALGRADAFAAGDLALQEAVRVLYGLDARPTEARLRAMAEDWSPWKAVAARILFAYYRVIKNREGLK